MSDSLCLSIKWLNLESLHKSAGQDLKVISGIEAKLSHGKKQIKLSVALSDPKLAISETRWLFGRLMDHLKALYPFKESQLSRGRAYPITFMRLLPWI